MLSIGKIKLIPMPPIWLLKEAFEIDPSIPHGIRWKIRPREHFNSDIGLNLFSEKHPGKPAGWKCAKYYRVTFSYWKDEKFVTVILHNHRVIWAMANNTDPGEMMVDHADLIKYNNSSDNLRLATSTESSRNKNIRKDNVSGACGVAQRADNGRWRARISVSGKLIDLGNFPTREGAVNARIAAEKAYFGEFAPNRSAS